MKSALSIINLIFILTGSALADEQAGGRIVEGVYENPKEGSPASYAIYETNGKVTKVEVTPDLSSHRLTVTGFFCKDGDLILFTVEMWDLLDEQGESRKNPKFHSIALYQVKEGKIIQRSTVDENRYFESSRIPNYLTKVIASAELSKTKKIAEQDGTVQPATRPESKSKSKGSEKPQPRAKGRSR